MLSGKKYNCTSGYIFDGDTLNLISSEGQFTCRLQWMDCCETQKAGKNSSDPKILKHWEWASVAKTTLINLVSGKQLIAIPYQKDQYDRWVCDLYVDRIVLATNLQIQLCKLGLATSYLPFNRHIYNTREVSVLRAIIGETATANRKKIGFWAETNFLLPYEMKKL